VTVRPLALIVLTACGAASAANPKPPECPPNTEKAKMDGMRGDYVEFCRDTKSGSQEGPSRLYDAKHRLMMEMVNDGGREVSRTYTAAGIARYIDDVNAATREVKMPWRFEIVDAHTLRYVATLDVDDGTVLNEKEVHAGVARERPCMLMLLPGATFQTLEVRMQKPGGKVWFRTTVAREECVRPGALKESG
jgi:hypothetical protein